MFHVIHYVCNNSEKVISLSCAGLHHPLRSWWSHQTDESGNILTKKVVSLARRPDKLSGNLINGDLLAGQTSKKINKHENPKTLQKHSFSWKWV